jgi:ribosomal protein S18 acetylase RimI-like enzyme
MTRILPHDEWQRIAWTEAAPAWASLDPARNTVIVTEDDGVIVGCVVLMQTLHAEFLWIAPEHRGRTAVARRLLSRLVTEAKAWGARTVLGSAMSFQMQDILGRLGRQLPGEHYVMNLQEMPSCRPQ